MIMVHKLFTYKQIHHIPTNTIRIKPKDHRACNRSGHESLANGDDATSGLQVLVVSVSANARPL